MTRPPNRPWSTPVVDWVIKLSRFCNLRCRYCYEFEFLADRRRMSLPQLERMFEHIAAHYVGTGKRMDFVWHGGEPLLIEPEYYRQIHALQRRILGGAEIEFRNHCQTNLTRLTPDTLALLKGFFDGVGVSIDVVGDQRVSRAGRPIEDVVKANLRILKSENIRFGCISVLSQKNVEQVERLYEFVAEEGESVRLLPIYRTGYPGQQEGLALTAAQILTAYRTVADRWLASDRLIRVQPLEDYLTNVVRKLMGDSVEPSYYDKVADEVVYIVGTDGSLYSTADAYAPDYCHGNIFEQPLAVMKESTNYRRAVGDARRRMDLTCAKCDYFGSCHGFFMAEATPEERRLDSDDRLVCAIARPMHEYLEQRLLETGLFPAPGRLATVAG